MQLVTAASYNKSENSKFKWFINCATSSRRNTMQI